MTLPPRHDREEDKRPERRRVINVGIILAVTAALALLIQWWQAR